MGNSSPPERVHPIRDTVEVVIEQSGVRVKCHRRRGGMPEHPLHRLHVRPSRDREARRCMPQPMRRKPIEPRSDRRGVEMIATEVEIAEDAAAATGEYRLVGRLTSDIRGKIVSEKRRPRSRLGAAGTPRRRRFVREGHRTHVRMLRLVNTAERR